MTWVRLDDQFAQHPKLVTAGPLGIALFVAGLAYCNRNLTDGFIPWAAARLLLSWEFRERNGRLGTVSVTSGLAGEDVTTEYVATLLIASGLWTEIDGGYVVHDYLDYQPSKEQVLAERASSAERQQRYRNAKSNGVTNGVTNGASHTTPTPTPTPKPVPDTQTNNPEPLSSGCARFFDLYENCIGTLSPSNAQRIMEWDERLPEGEDGESIVEYAFEEAEEQGKLNLSYVEGILKRLEGEGWPMDDDCQ